MATKTKIKILVETRNANGTREVSFNSEKSAAYYEYLWKLEGHTVTRI